MSTHRISRRKFVAGVAAGSAAAALATTAPAAQSQKPVVTSTFPVAEPKPSQSPVRILCAEKLSPAEVETIRSSGKNIDLVVLANRSELKDRAADAEVILGVVDRDTMLAARNLRWVQTWAAGLESLPRELMDHPCVLTNMQRVFAPVIAETVFAFALSLTRGLSHHAIPNFQARKWERSDPGLEDLYLKTLGVVGLGGIGTETARRGHYGFNMRVLATDAKPLPRPEFVAELREPGWLMEMVPQVDVLVSCAPQTKETAGLFNEALFRKMKPTAYFINVSRGGLVDQPALIRALGEGWIRGAGLDVTTPEPLPSEHPLWDCPNLIITPHDAGQAPIRQRRIVALVAENVRRYTEGLPLLNVVDKARGY